MAHPARPRFDRPRVRLCSGSAPRAGVERLDDGGGPRGLPADREEAPADKRGDAAIDLDIRRAQLLPGSRLEIEGGWVRRRGAPTEQKHTVPNQDRAREAARHRHIRQVGGHTGLGIPYFRASLRTRVVSAENVKLAAPDHARKSVASMVQGAGALPGVLPRIVNLDGGGVQLRSATRIRPHSADSVELPEDRNQSEARAGSSKCGNA